MKKVWNSLLLFLFIFLSGCTREQYIILINNSGQALIIHQDKKIYQCPTNSVIQFQWPSTLYIESPGTNVWHYKITLLDNWYGEKGKFYMQIESSGAIYVLPPQTKQLVKPLPPQPPNFPWKPSS